MIFFHGLLITFFVVTIINLIFLSKCSVTYVCAYTAIELVITILTLFYDPGISGLFRNLVRKKCKTISNLKKKIVYICISLYNKTNNPKLKFKRTYIHK